MAISASHIEHPPNLFSVDLDRFHSNVLKAVTTATIKSARRQPRHEINLHRGNGYCQEIARSTSSFIVRRNEGPKEGWKQPVRTLLFLYIHFRSSFQDGINRSEQQCRTIYEIKYCTTIFITVLYRLICSSLIIADNAGERNLRRVDVTCNIFKSNPRTEAIEICATDWVHCRLR